MKTKLLLLAFSAIGINSVHAMCGCMFPVAPPSQTEHLADLNLYNESSKVILARDGNHTVITMSNDFQGNVKDFALVIPVPTVLKEKDIRVVDASLFDGFNRASAPQYTQNFDMNPCQMWGGNEFTLSDSRAESVTSGGSSGGVAQQSQNGTVKIEAQYSIGEYEILVLSATESEGLLTWLEENGYGISAAAEEVVKPYVKSGMKFFVAKVNLKKQQNEFAQLSPIQIEFETNRFVLPIRFGMANAKGNQDMVVYGLTRNGRMEATNYRTVNMPTNFGLPEFIKNDFNTFYSAAFETKWKREGGNAIVLEYASSGRDAEVANIDVWGRPLPLSTWSNLDFEKAGVWWLEDDDNVFLTRLHIRYNRADWSQDIQFQSTPNTSSFRINYQMNTINKDNLNCDQAQFYLHQIVKRREAELQAMANLTGWDINKYSSYLDVWKETGVKRTTSKQGVPPVTPRRNGGNWWILYALGAVAALSQLPFKKRKAVYS